MVEKFAFHCNVFAYGSLMDPTQVASTLRASTADAKSRMAPALLRNWKRSYSKFSSKWRCNVLNIEPCMGKVVSGVFITKLTPEELDTIKKEKRVIQLSGGGNRKGEKLSAYTFVAEPVERGCFKKHVQLVERAARSYGTEFYQLFKESFNT
ncbi:MAG: gamma-glutamylcyclotransferase [Hadesarchaea archaeon]|nr:gamma-glutamylcyclotransferase [Hadesarchaea archaeon]